MALVPSGLKSNLATTTYVNETVSRYIPTGTVTDITLGKGLTGTYDVITYSGDIGLSATLADLTNVSINPPQQWDVLTYNGTAWAPYVFSGAGTSPLAMTQLSDFPPTFIGNNNNLMKVNNEGTAVVFDQLRYASTFVDGAGIASNKNDNTVRLDLNLSTLSEVYDANETTYIPILKDNGSQGKTKSSNINLQSFGNIPGLTQYMTNNAIHGASPLSWDTSTMTMSISAAALSKVDFEAGNINGILGIPYGGTSGSTAPEARGYLGVSYNTDVLSCRNPVYTGTLHGGDILLSSDTITGAGILNQGTCYITGGSGYYILIDGIRVNVNITGTGTAGTITSYTLGDEFGILRGKLPTTTFPESIIGPLGSGSNGQIQLLPDDQYLNFGNTGGESGFGIKYSVDSQRIEFRNPTGSWQPNVPFNIDEATDVNGQGPIGGTSTVGSLMIWNPVSGQWNINRLYGDITINADGGTSLTTGSIDPSRLIPNTVNSTEFGYLDGVTDFIQTQLDNKIKIPPDSTAGDLLYFNGTGASWVPLKLDTSGTKVLTSSGSCLSAPEWNDISFAFENQAVPGTSTNVNIPYFIGVSGLGKQTNFGDVLNNYIAPTGGIDNTASYRLVTNINNLPVGSMDVTTDIISFNHPPDSYFDKKITISEFCCVIAGTGLCEASGQLVLDPTPLPDSLWGSPSAAWSAIHTNMLILNTGYTHTTLPTGSTGRMVYVSDSDGLGTPSLGVYDGTIWQKILFDGAF